MSAHLITLQDHDVRVHGNDVILASSPGFASTNGKQPLYGEAARQLSRLYPRDSFNKFWTQLSLDPLGIKNKHFRHAADLAHGHLQSLTSDLKLNKNTVIAVPSNYSRKQLSVLLGIVRTCEIPVNGLVDLSLLQALASGSEADNCIILDLQLHQAVLTSFHRVNGHLQRDRVIQVPASGLLALQDAWTNLVADEFIRQTRFDPKHNAELEQYLYNQLDQWLLQSATDNELLIDLNHKGTVRQARLSHDAFMQRSGTVFERIRKELEQLRSKDSSVHVLRSQLQLPGLMNAIPGISGLDDKLLHQTCLSQLRNIQSDPEQLQFITRLPTGKTDDSTSLPDTAALTLPSHVLIGTQAYPLPIGRLALGAEPAAGTYARSITVDGLPAAATIILIRKRNHLQLELQGVDALLCNDVAVTSGAELKLGDQLQLTTAGPVLKLIQVE